MANGMYMHMYVEEMIGGSVMTADYMTESWGAMGKILFVSTTIEAIVGGIRDVLFGVSMDKRSLKRN